MNELWYPPALFYGCEAEWAMAYFFVEASETGRAEARAQGCSESAYLVDKLVESAQTSRKVLRPALEPRGSTLLQEAAKTAASVHMKPILGGAWRLVGLSGHLSLWMLADDGYVVVLYVDHVAFIRRAHLRLGPLSKEDPAAFARKWYSEDTKGVELIVRRAQVRLGNDLVERGHRVGLARRNDVQEYLVPWEGTVVEPDVPMWMGNKSVWKAQSPGIVRCRQWVMSWSEERLPYPDGTIYHYKGGVIYAAEKHGSIQLFV